MTDRETKVFEDRLRRMADRRGLILSKSRARDPGSLMYGGYTWSTRRPEALTSAMATPAATMRPRWRTSSSICPRTDAAE